MRKTKIVCTLGPATDKESMMEEMIQKGMDVARFNFSHGTYEEHAARMKLLKAARQKAGLPIAALLDTKGPEIRIQKFKEGSVTLKEGQKFTLLAKETLGTKDYISITYKSLYKDIQPGTKILIDDGLVELRADYIENKNICCTVINGGTISDQKGINVPGIHLTMPYLSTKDKEDIVFGIRQDMDFIAASFVREAADVNAIRKILYDNGGSGINIIAKIENRQGVDNIDEIIEAADGIMIARGDMGVEIPLEEVPIIQKMIIRKVYEAGKQVITATQMLESMIKHPRPTRAETTDVANAIYDGTSAIMLSGETAIGLYPVEAVETMGRIADRTERDIDYRKRFFEKERKSNPDIADAISHATCTTALDLSAKVIVTVTKTGRSARLISRYRPECDIIGCSMKEKVCRQLNMSWGVRPVLLEEKEDVFELFAHTFSVLKDLGYVDTGDIAVVTSGVPIGIAGTTNLLKVQIVE